MSITAIIILVIVTILVITYITTYNKLVRMKNKTEESEAQIGAHEKQRYDLVPNLVETVKGYASHERETLEAVITARNAAAAAPSVQDAEVGNKQLNTALKSIFALSESYPDLKANTNFLQLQQQLTEIEEKILNARKYYNAVIREFNNLCETFPSNIVANIGHYTKKEYLQIEEAEKQNVKVKF
ncbi:MAG: LemA family protein [Sphaerochaetaceae bacterium]|nr:LemA family protein [Sphaerochaetaceae bacterium]